jgi:hypothetical protein
VILGFIADLRDV